MAKRGMLVVRCGNKKKTILSIVDSIVTLDIMLKHTAIPLVISCLMNNLLYCWVRAARERAAHEADVAGNGFVGCEKEGRVGAGGLVAG